MVTNLLSPNVWVTLLVTSGFYLQQTCADNYSNYNGAGSGTKIPCPDSKEAEKLFAGRELNISDEDKKNVDNYDKNAVSKVAMKLYKNVQDKQKLKNKDPDSYSDIRELCATTVEDYTIFLEQLYSGLSKCGERFCSDVRACIGSNNLCPQESDNSTVLKNYTRCVKVQYKIEYKNKTIPDNYQDVCVCAYCTNKTNAAIFYLLFENTEMPGVYFYQQLDSNPYTWDSSALNPHYKVKIPNTQNSSQDVNLDYYAFFDKNKYTELFELKNSPNSTCQSGAIYNVVKSKASPAQ